MKAYQYKAQHADVENIYGACLFLGYIIAALVFSFRAVNRIFRRFQAQICATTRKPRMLVFLALLSFCTLSFNMLSFLYLSYSNYIARHQSRPTFTNTHLWAWMSQTSLFVDFAHALVESQESRWWTQLALLLSYPIISWLCRTCKIHI